MRADRTRFRVRYPETDRMGVAHHTHVFVWFELGRTELMREAGATYGALEDGGLFFPVVEASARYHRSAGYDEELEVRTTLAELRGAQVRFEYAIHRDGEEEPLARGHTVHAAVDRRGRPVRIPQALRRRLEPT